MKVLRLTSDRRPLASFSLGTNGEVEAQYASQTLEDDMSRGLLHQGKRLTPADGQAFMDALDAVYRRSTTMYVDNDLYTPARRRDYDENQPRDENGRWGSGGGVTPGVNDHPFAIPPARKNARSLSREARRPLDKHAPTGWKDPRPAPSEVEGLKTKLASSRTGPGYENKYNEEDRLEKAIKGAEYRLKRGDKPVQNEEWSYDLEDHVLSQPGHLYRGMSQEEYDATVGAGAGVNSLNKYSVDIEGTNFGYEFSTARSYVDAGDSKALPGRPAYVVEVKENPHLTYNSIAEYPQTEVGEGLPQRNVTKVYKIERDDPNGNRKITEIGVPEEDLKATEKMVTRGSLGIPREEMPQLPSNILANALDNFEDRGFSVQRNVQRSVLDLKPTQSTMNMEKVDKLVKEAPIDWLSKPVVVSEDDHILDGHHRWAALKIRDPHAKVTTHQVGMPIKDLVEFANQHPDVIRRTTNDTADIRTDMKTTRLDTAIQELQTQKAELEQQLEVLRKARAMLASRQDDWNEEDHPRVPAGGEGGGQFGSGGGGKSRGKKSEGRARSKKISVEQAESALSGAGQQTRPLGAPSKGLKEISERMGKQFKSVDHPTVPVSNGETVTPKNPDEKPNPPRGAQKSVEPKAWHGQAKGYVDTERAYSKNGVYAPARVAVHAEYAKDVLSKNLPKSDSPTFHMTGGGFASGKTSALLKNPLTKIPGEDQAAHLSADKARAYIPEYRAGVKAGDPLAATFVQEESSHTAKQALEKAIKRGHDVVYDSSGDSGVDRLEAKLKQYREWGVKRIEANYATLDVDEAVKRSDFRAKQPGEDFGRFIPHETIRENHANVTQTVLGAIDRKLFDKLDVWSNDPGIGSSPDKPVPPKHLATYTKEHGLRVHDPAGWEVFKSRAKPLPKG